MGFRAWAQHTGLADSVQALRSIATDDTTAKMLGSGVAIVAVAIWDTSQSVLFAAVGGAWVCWMVLGYIASRESGEEFEIQKIISGVHVLAAAVTTIYLCVMMTSAFEEAGVWSAWLPVFAQSWVMVGFSMKALQKADRVLPGVRGAITAHLPDLVARLVPAEQDKRKDP